MNQRWELLSFLPPCSLRDVGQCERVERGNGSCEGVERASGLCEGVERASGLCERVERGSVWCERVEKCRWVSQREWCQCGGETKECEEVEKYLQEGVQKEG